jgi:hypothetical protein
MVRPHPAVDPRARMADHIAEVLVNEQLELAESVALSSFVYYRRC